MGRVFCLPVFSRRANKIKVQDETLTVVSTPNPASQAAATDSSAAKETESCYFGGGGELVLEVGDAFSDPGLYGRDFSESCASEEIVGGNNNIVASLDDVTTLLPDRDDQHGDDHDHVQSLQVTKVASDTEELLTTTTTTAASVTALNRVEEWVKSIDNTVTEPLVELLVGETSSHGRSGSHGSSSSNRDLELSNTLARSLDFHSTVGHFTGLGLTIVPSLAAFSHLKVLKLSANSIVRISPGVLPKGLHSLDLSRNNISVIEGLRELTKLRSLNLSYNRILRIGQGLANCTSIRELYLACNKINELEGLHRLTKLSSLDLSFNRLSSTKSLGQIAATSTSLMAVNLVGNPVLANVGEEQLKRFITGLAPNLVVLNKQALKGGGASARSLVAGTSSSRHSPHHNSSSSKRAGGNASSSSTAAASARNRGHHHHHHQQPEQQQQQRDFSRMHRVQSDGALQDRQVG